MRGHRYYLRINYYYYCALTRKDCTMPKSRLFETCKTCETLIDYKKRKRNKGSVLKAEESKDER